MKTRTIDILCDSDRLNAILDTLIESLWLGPVDSIYSVSSTYTPHRDSAFWSHKRETKSLRAVTSFLHEQINERMAVVLFKREEALAFSHELTPVSTSSSKHITTPVNTPPMRERRERAWKATQGQKLGFDFNELVPMQQQRRQQPYMNTRATSLDAFDTNRGSGIGEEKMKAINPVMETSSKLRKRHSARILISPPQDQHHFAKKPPAADNKPGYLAATISSSSRHRPPRSGGPHDQVENSSNHLRYSLSSSPSGFYSTNYYDHLQSLANYNTSNRINSSTDNVNSSDYKSPKKPTALPRGLKKMKSAGILRERTYVNRRALSPPPMPLTPLNSELLSPDVDYSSRRYTLYGAAMAMTTTTEVTVSTRRSSMMSPHYQYYRSFSRSSVQESPGNLEKNLGMLAPYGSLNDAF